MDDYKTVFEISQKGFIWWFAFIWVIPAIIAAAIWRWRRSHEISGRTVWLAYSLPAFALIWLVGCCIPMVLDYNKLQHAYRSGSYSTVEGHVEDFHPMPPQGHSSECFQVQSREFCYGADSIMPEFNNDSAHGGPVRPGLSVRIGYVGNDILKLEIESAH